VKDRIYLDYNATSPLSKRVIDFLGKGDLSLVNANPSSNHSSGKKSKKTINSVSDYLLDSFHFKKSHSVLFNSGATEAINTFFRLKKSDLMIYAVTDHPAVIAMADFNKSYGVDAIALEVDRNGNIDINELKLILDSTSKNVFLNITLVHNENGSIFELSPIIELKNNYNFILHVDAVQSVMRFDGWNHLSEKIDAVSYSAHKFGALKGIGFSFIKSEFKFAPLLNGGGQQAGLRSGTENPLATYSIQLALEKSIELKRAIVNLFKTVLGESGIVIFENNSNQACNTVPLIFKKFKSDISLIHFDMEGIDISYGSACASGSIEGTQSLKSLGLSEYSKNFVRLSFGPFDYKNSESILKHLENVFNKLK
jgi:cysteine desulfurase